MDRLLTAGSSGVFVVGDADDTTGDGGLVLVFVIFMSEVHVVKMKERCRSSANPRLSGKQQNGE